MCARAVQLPELSGFVAAEEENGMNADGEALKGAEAQEGARLMVVKGGLAEFWVENMQCGSRRISPSDQGGGSELGSPRTTAALWVRAAKEGEDQGSDRPMHT